MKQMTQAEVVEMFKTKSGTDIGCITQKTVVKMNKTDNPFFNRVSKVSTLGVMVGASYESGINRRLEAVGLTPDFVSEGRSNGLTSVEGTSGKILCNRDGELLLNYMVNDRVTPQVSYLLDGQKVEGMTFEAIKPWLPIVKESSKQAEAGLDTMEQVKVRTVKLKNILTMQIKGETIVIV